MPILEIQGQRVEVDEAFLTMTPEQQSTTVEEIAQSLNISAQNTNIQQPQEQPPIKKTMLEDAYSQAEYGARRGLYGLANAPNMVANAVLGGANKIAEEFGGNVDFRFPNIGGERFEKTIMNTPQPEYATGRLAGSVMEQIGASTIPAVGLISKAKQLANIVKPATTVAGAMIRNLAKPIAKSPALALGGEMLGAAGAGVGAQTAREIAPNNSGAEFAGAMLGGIGAPIAAGAMTAGLLRKALKAGKGAGAAVSRHQNAKLINAINNNMTDDTIRSINETTEINKIIPDYKPSLGEATQSPSFIATQKNLERSLSGTQLDEAIRRYSTNERAVASARDNLAPPQQYLDDALSQRANREANITGRIDQSVNRLDDVSANYANRLEGNTLRSDVGAGLREGVYDARASAKKRMDRVYQDFGLNNNDEIFDFGAMKKRLIASTELEQGANSANRPYNLIKDINKMESTQSINGLLKLRSRIGEDIRISKSVPMMRGQEPYLQRALSELDGLIDEAVRATGDQEMAGNIVKARDIYRREFVEPFKQGATGRILAQKDGDYLIPNEKVAKEYFNGWNQSSAKQFNEIFPQGSQAQRALQDVALDDLYNSAVRDGQLNRNLFNAWKRRNKGALQTMPNLNNKIENISETMSDIVKRRASLLNRKEAIENSYLAREIAKINNPMTTYNVDALVNNAIKNPAQMRNLVSSLSTKQAKDALARKVWDNVLDQANPLEFLKKNGLSITPALGEYNNSALRIAQAMRKNKLVPPPSGQGIATSPIAEAEAVLGMSGAGLANRSLQVRGGFIGARYAVLDVLSRVMRATTSRQSKKTLRAALYDPQIAMDLANTLQMGTISEPTAKRLYSWLIGSGIIAASDYDVVERQ